MIFKHFVITRFNLRLESHFNIDKNGHPTQTNEWLENRFHLFEKFCLPSLRNQTNKNFIWFVLFDTHTPQYFKDRIFKYREEFEQFYPLFLESGEKDYLNKFLNTSILSFVDDDTQYVISTRIDNDDAFHRDMISEVQLLFRKQEDEYINFEFGLQYDLINKTLVRFFYKKNHFLSRVEKFSNRISTVIYDDHSRIETVTKVQNIKLSKPLWVEVVHHSNVSNSTRILLPYKSQNMSKYFGFECKIDKFNTKELQKKYLKCWIYVTFKTITSSMGLFNLYKKTINAFK